MLIVKVKKGCSGNRGGCRRGGKVSAPPYKFIAGPSAVTNEIYQTAANAGENAKDALRNARVKKSLLPKKYITFE